MTSKRVFYILTGCLVALTGVGIGGIVFGNKLLQESAAKLNDLKLETNVIDAQQSSLARAKRDIEQYAELEQIAKTVVPQEKDQARTVREIVRFADETNVPIASITFPTSELGEQAARPSSGSQNQASGSSGTSKPSTPAISQVEPVEGIKNVYQMQISIQNNAETPATYAAFINFLKKLEQNRRTSQVTNIGIQPNPENRNLITYNMTITVYISAAK